MKELGAGRSSGPYSSATILLSVPRAFSFVVSEEGRPFFPIWLRWMNSGSILQETANTSDPVPQRIFRKSRNRACTSAHEVRVRSIAFGIGLRTANRAKVQAVRRAPLAY